MDNFSKLCLEFSQTISLKKANLMVKVIKLNNYNLEVVHDFPYLSSNISDTLSLDTEINRWIGQAVL